VELVFIGLIVYWAVNFLEGTRGERLFRGVIFILVSGSLLLKLVVEKFAFERLEYLYSGFLIAVLIIAVAGFQPEIRRALIRIGQTRFIRRSSRQVSKVIDEIAAAVTQMSATRTGAIIAIENQVALGEFIEAGVAVDAKVTSDLLQTIFYPGSPLHDMAVVIRADRLVAARVQLPLAEVGPSDGFQLGSRHRAAVGATTGSDALVIIVSEETGIISLAVNGVLIRNVSEEQLRQHLIGAMAETSPIMERIWRRRMAAKT
jgi:diadenylate cyclase